MPKDILFHDGTRHVSKVAVTSVNYDPKTLKPVKYNFEPKHSWQLSKDKLQRTEIVNLDENEMFQWCKSIWDIEDEFEFFWTRINPLGTGWKPKELVKVLKVEEVN